MRIFLLSIIVLFLSVMAAVAQEETPYYLDNRGKDALLAPRIGLGAGFFTYLGDVQDNNVNHPFTSSWGYEFLTSANISRYFDLNLNITYGDMTVNERSTDVLRNRNFKSEIFIGGVGVSYNFNHLYKKPGIVQPFVSVGVAFIHFDSHTDLRDADGNLYHYWSDGSIMNVAENSETAGQATELQRDYTYESDLRQMNNDGLGKYDLFTFSVPVSLGLDFKMGRRMSGRLSSSFYYTFTDLMDDFTWRGSGEREGDKANDMFLYTSLSVSYSIGVKSEYTKTEKSNVFEEFDFYAMSLADSDGDGVNDFDDQCANTAEGIKIDTFGCPLDTDRDLIQDFRDKEEMTGIDKIANLEGIGLTDEMMLKTYEDSVAMERARIALVYPNGVLEIVKKSSDSKAKSSDLTDVKSIAPTVAVAAAPAKAAPATTATTTTGATTTPVATAPAVAPAQSATTQQAESTKPVTGAQSPSSTSVASENSATVKSGDIAKLTEMMNSIASDAGKETPTSVLMDEIMKEVFSGSPENAASVEDVYDAAYRVYGKMVDDGRIDSKAAINISRNAANAELIPVSFRSVDYNGDGLISSDEMLRAIEEVVDGNSTLSVADAYGLVKFYKDVMEDARVVDFGGTKAVYVDGRLNILENYEDDGLTSNQRFLAKKFSNVDYNGDGRLTADEVTRAIEEFKSKKSSYSADDINHLIDLFFED